jgi:hypothetical protein
MRRPFVVLGRGRLFELICLSDFPVGGDPGDAGGRFALNGSDHNFTYDDNGNMQTGPESRTPITSSPTRNTMPLAAIKRLACKRNRRKGKREQLFHNPPH